MGTVTEDSTRSSFKLIEDVSIYGGFDGTETARDERDWKTNVTILSGDIDQNDTTVGDVVVITPETNIAGLNAKTVVSGISSLNTLLDGVTITAGSGGEAAAVFGGGPFRRCVMQGNYGEITGAIASFGSMFTLIECDILANTARLFGAVSAYSLDGFEMTSCRVQGNTATSMSSNVGVGALHLGQADASITNCLITGNVGYYQGGIVMRSSGKLHLCNSTITGNYAYETSGESTSGGLAVESGATCYAYNSIIWGNESPQNDNVYGITYQENMLIEGDLASGSGSLNGDPGNDPQFLTAINASATATTSGDFRLNGSSTAVGSGDGFTLEPDSGDLDEDGDLDEVLPCDLAGNARIIDTMDIGAYEYTGPTLTGVSIGTLELLENASGYVDLLDLDTIFNESGLAYAMTEITGGVITPQISGATFAAAVIGSSGSSASVQITATDAAGDKNTITFTVTIVAAPTALESFRTTYGLASDGSDDYEDASGNGVANILYFAFNLGDPSGTALTYADADAGTMGLPAFAVAEDGATCTFTYVRTIGFTGIDDVAQYSSDLSTWGNVIDLDGLLQSTTVTAIDGDYEFVTYELTLSDAALFFRVEISVD